MALSLELTFENGAQAYIEVGTYNFIALPRFYMQAKDGSALITDWRRKVPGGTLQGVARERCAAGADGGGPDEDDGAARRGNDGYV